MGSALVHLSHNWNWHVVNTTIIYTGNGISNDYSTYTTHDGDDERRLEYFENTWLYIRFDMCIIAWMEQLWCSGSGTFGIF